jgi:hypothetical protein
LNFFSFRELIGEVKVPLAALLNFRCSPVKTLIELPVSNYKPEQIFEIYINFLLAINIDRLNFLIILLLLMVSWNKIVVVLMESPNVINPFIMVL